MREVEVSATKNAMRITVQYVLRSAEKLGHGFELVTLRGFVQDLIAFVHVPHHLSFFWFGMCLPAKFRSRMPAVQMRGLGNFVLGGAALEGLMCRGF